MLHTWPANLESSAVLYRSIQMREMKNIIFKSLVKTKTSKIYFLVHDKISFIGAPSKGTPVAHGGISSSLVLYRSHPLSAKSVRSTHPRKYQSVFICPCPQLPAHSKATHS
jgi:hypothetical protein